MSVKLTNPEDIKEKILCYMLSSFPFYGRASMYLNWEINNNLNPPTAATDGKTVWFHPDFLKKTADTEFKHLVTVAIHELHHVIFKHNIRRRYRDPLLWNIACDYAINYQLKHNLHESMVNIKNWLYDPKYKDMHEEDIYDELLKDPKFKKEGAAKAMLDGTSTGSYEFSDEPGEVEEAEEHRRVDRMIEASAKYARDAGKMPGYLEEFYNKNRTPQVDWKAKLRQFFAPVIPKNVSWSRLNRRAISRSIYMPGIEKIGTGNVAVLIDTSGSVTEEELQAYVSELNYLFNEMTPQRVQVIWFNSRVWREDIYQAGEMLVVPKNIESGGTSFENAFREVKKDSQVAVCLTDMYDSFSFQPPRCPTIWVATTDQKAPWGSTIRIKV